MGWYLIAIGAIMGFLIATLRKLPPKKTTTSQKLGREHGIHYPHYRTTDFGRNMGISRRFLERSRRLHGPFQTARTDTRRLVKDWEKSIFGLVKLAEKNLQVAAESLKIRDYKGTVNAASTSVENISRALIHCYGGKPNPGQGQEEALRLISQRLSEDERPEFREAIERIVKINHSKASYPYYLHNTSAYNIQIESLDRAETKGILESASNVMRLFENIMATHFATEIPGLDEICPKCHSTEGTVSCFNNQKVKYQCSRCRHKWIRPHRILQYVSSNSNRLDQRCGSL